MGRSGPELTREHADKVVKKLRASVEKSLRSGHDIATVYYEEEAILSFGIRRGSSKDSGHGHLTEDLFLPPSQVKRLANCPMSYQEWVERMKDKKVIIEKPKAEGE
ncbi:MAG TPA: hypothetical protein VGS22_01595 [Thermoanaerobaculia bacterium]|jgi:hypothetical protein|nr:hypothetical protein [Thermoanaerobaculia bacterium]